MTPGFCASRTRFTFSRWLWLSFSHRLRLSKSTVGRSKSKLVNGKKTCDSLQAVKCMDKAYKGQTQRTTLIHSLDTSGNASETTGSGSFTKSCSRVFNFLHLREEKLIQNKCKRFQDFASSCFNSLATALK